MDICGQTYTYPDLLRYCNPSSLYGARRVVVNDGRGHGQKLVEVKTAAGLRATFLEDKCLDIIDLEYKGVNLGFLSKNGMTSDANPKTNSYRNYWSGGFLFTCGLRNMGPPCNIGDENFPQHGNIGLTPMQHVNISVDENEIVISGQAQETALFGHFLEMKRKITIPSDGAAITVNDVVYNRTPKEEPLFLLYHINFGFPFLNENLVVNLPEGEIWGRENYKDMDKCTQMSPPDDNAGEQVFFKKTPQKKSVVNLTNRLLNIDAEISYDGTQLPVLAMWKSMRSGDYALGIEPCVSHMRGRKQALENGYDVKIAGFESVEYGFTFKVKG